MQLVSGPGNCPTHESGAAAKATAYLVAFTVAATKLQGSMAFSPLGPTSQLLGLYAVDRQPGCRLWLRPLRRRSTAGLSNLIHTVAQSIDSQAVG